MAGEMLATGGHAGAMQAIDQRRGEFADRPRVAVESAVADDRAAPPIEVENRRKRQVDPAGAQLGRQHVTDAPRRQRRRLGLPIPQLAEAAHRRQAGETAAAALYPAPLVVDTNQQRRRAQRMHFGGQPRQLLRRLVVACEEDQAADQRVPQALSFQLGEAAAGKVDHQRTGCNLGRVGHDGSNDCSRMTKATA
ncbi:MAG: hypothetical protein AW12_01252 [Candidatus Accumulibacter sp. BA-94]|nr:MAG: hypothetical protein AW12_01252 [Candidatus Accumulibacter sp. BA-94]